MGLFVCSRAALFTIHLWLIYQLIASSLLCYVQASWNVNIARLRCDIRGGLLNFGQVGHACLLYVYAAQYQRDNLRQYARDMIKWKRALFRSDVR
ncbi:hypothetical protein F4825DRAFT_414337 [Nemania diffusa]|nr:hypothetical protein F4825DRAFT_414337 [Nemania diffusa]